MRFLEDFAARRIFCIVREEPAVMDLGALLIVGKRRPAPGGSSRVLGRTTDGQLGPTKPGVAAK